MTQYQSFPTNNGMAPDGGPRCLPINLDFTVNASAVIDLVGSLSIGEMNFIQTMWVDNSTNANALTIVWDITQQKIVVPAYAQSTWPVFVPTAAAKFTASTTAGGGVKPVVILTNVPMPLAQWGPQSVTVNNVNATMTPVVAAFSNRGGAIAVGATPQQLCAANAARKRLFVQNVIGANNNEILSITFPSGAQIDIAPGTWWDSGDAPVDGGIINIVAATTSHTFNAFEA